ncbi:MAG: hypothetical protein WCT37_04135 [Patescibacteria group bacterium]|jgi:hypothetical protein
MPFYLKSKKLIIILLAVVIIPLIGLVVLLLKSDKTEYLSVDDLTKGSYEYRWLSDMGSTPEKLVREYKTRTDECYNIPESLVQKCSEAGGVLEYHLINVGFGGGASAFGCYPKGKPDDAGKICKKDSDCDNWCLWLNGDMIYPGLTSTCSAFKKPIFVFSEKNQDYHNGGPGPFCGYTDEKYANY